MHLPAFSHALATTPTRCAFALLGVLAAACGGAPDEAPPTTEKVPRIEPTIYEPPPEQAPAPTTSTAPTPDPAAPPAAPTQPPIATLADLDAIVPVIAERPTTPRSQSW